VKLLLWPFSAIWLAVAFSRDLVISSLQVAKTVLLPGDRAQPRFVTVPLLSARSGLEISMVANYITLTPGTLTVDVSPDRTTLLVHSLLAGESGDEVRADVQQGIEPRVTRVTRP
jgi:multicomponent Na+:H+ antiporter subunit E